MMEPQTGLETDIYWGRARGGPDSACWWAARLGETKDIHYFLKWGIYWAVWMGWWHSWVRHIMFVDGLTRLLVLLSERRAEKKV